MIISCGENLIRIEGLSPDTAETRVHPHLTEKGKRKKRARVRSDYARSRLRELTTGSHACWPSRAGSVHVNAWAVQARRLRSDDSLTTGSAVVSPASLLLRIAEYPNTYFPHPLERSIMLTDMTRCYHRPDVGSAHYVSDLQETNVGGSAWGADGPDPLGAAA